MNDLIKFRSQIALANKSLKSIGVESSTEEIVDTLFDIAKAVNTVETSLEDDFQLTDVLGWLALEKEGREIINDFPVFTSQLISAAPERVKQAVEEADQRFSSTMTYGKVSKAFMNGLYALACWYSTGAIAYYGFNDNIEKSKQLFAGKRILPV